VACRGLQERDDRGLNPALEAALLGKRRVVGYREQHVRAVRKGRVVDTGKHPFLLHERDAGAVHPVVETGRDTEGCRRAHDRTEGLEDAFLHHGCDGKGGLHETGVPGVFPVAAPGGAGGQPDFFDPEHGFMPLVPFAKMKAEGADELEPPEREL